MVEVATTPPALASAVADKVDPLAAKKPDPLAKKGLTAAPAKKQVSLTIIRAKDMPFWSTFRMGVLSAPGKGKTWLFQTLSKAWQQDEHGHPPDGLALDDLLSVVTDEGGLHGMREYRTDMPTLDLGGLSDNDIFAAFPSLPRVIAEHAVANKTRGVCLDTGSRLIKAAVAVLSKSYEGPRLYNQLSMVTRDLCFGLRTVPCPIIWNLHIRPPQVVMQGLDVADMPGTRIAAGLEHDGLEMDIEGRGAKQLVRDSCDLVFHLDVRELPGGKTDRRLTCDTRVESKMRLQRYVNANEPPDLGKLFAKIAAGVGAPLP